MMITYSNDGFLYVSAFVVFYNQPYQAAALEHTNACSVFPMYSASQNVVGKKTCESAFRPLTFGANINGIVLSRMATALYSREYSTSAF